MEKYINTSLVMAEPIPQKKSWFEKIAFAISGEPKDREDLLQVLKGASERALINPDSLNMIEGVLEVHELQVEDIMITRSQMVVIDISSPLEEILSVVIKSGHSRFPVIDGNKDEILGTFLAKDLLSLLASTKEREDFNFKEHLRQPIFIPESKKLHTLLHDFRNNRNHLAIVIDEYGSVTGLVTIEDVIEQIVGEIEDEFDIEDAPYIKKSDNNNFIIKAITPVEDFNEYFNSKFSDQEVDTIGGVLIRHFGRVPKPGESTKLNNFKFTVIRSDGRRLLLLRAYKAK